ncbi:MAG: hypothetical protein NUV67_01785 [archaeon]|nr:hypothetical protein [archaeon]
MAKKIFFMGAGAFECTICGMKYREKSHADACETWCKEHPNTCDPKIAKKSIQE